MAPLRDDALGQLDHGLASSHFDRSVNWANRVEARMRTDVLE